ncbi:MAG: hypothetical protein WCA10_16805, partial [Terracidiphilus sp.]
MMPNFRWSGRARSDVVLSGIARLVELHPQLQVKDVELDRKLLVLSAETGQQWIRKDLAFDEIAVLATVSLTAENLTW